MILTATLTSVTAMGTARGAMRAARRCPTGCCSSGRWRSLTPGRPTRCARSAALSTSTADAHGPARLRVRTLVGRAAGRRLDELVGRGGSERIDRLRVDVPGSSPGTRASPGARRCATLGGRPSSCGSAWDLREGVETVAAVRAAVGGDMAIMVDANEGTADARRSCAPAWDVVDGGGVRRRARAARCPPAWRSCSPARTSRATPSFAGSPNASRPPERWCAARRRRSTRSIRGGIDADPGRRRTGRRHRRLLLRGRDRRGRRPEWRPTCGHTATAFWPTCTSRSPSRPARSWRVPYDPPGWTPSGETSQSRPGRSALTGC